MSAVATLRPRRAPERAHLAVVRPTPVRRPGRYVIGAVLVGAATIFGAVSLDALAAGASVEARALEGQVAEAERRYDDLVVEVARLEEPGRIRSAALDLGLVPAGSARYVTVDRNLPADGVVAEVVAPGEPTDPMKPLLSVDR